MIRTLVRGLTIHEFRNRYFRWISECHSHHDRDINAAWNILRVGRDSLRAAQTTASSNEPNIEDTIVAASLEGITQEDYRTLSLLADWFGVHFERVNADRLFQIVRGIQDKRGKAFWAALACWQKRDWRFKRFQKLYTKPRLDLMGDGTSYQIERHGEDERFVGTPLRIPAKLLRQRPADILLPHVLALKHRAYYYRVMIGSSYRADMWALIELNSSLSPA